MKEDFKYIIFLLVIVAGFFLIGRCTAPKPDGEATKKIDIINNKLSHALAELDSRVTTGRRIDTVIHTVFVPKRIIEYRDTGKVVFVGDSTYSSKAFVATIDTVIGDCDTLSFAYAFPQNSIYWQLRQCPDTIRTVFINEKIFETKVVARPLWLDVLSHTGASIVGFAVGYAVGR